MLHEALLIYVLREMHLLEIYTQDERVNLIIEYVRVSASVYKYKMADCHSRWFNPHETSHFHILTLCSYFTLALA